MKVQLRLSQHLIAVLAIFGTILLSACGSSPSQKQDSPAPEKVYVNGDLHVVGKKGDMHFETYGGEKAFGGESFHFARDFFRGYASVVKMVDGKELHGVINLKGEKVIPIEHEGFVGTYENGGYFPIGQMNKRGYIDSTGKIVIPQIYSHAEGVYDGLFVMGKDLKYGVLNLKAEVVVPFIYNKVYGYAENGLMAVEKNYKSGFVDRKGTEVIPCIYASATSFEGDLAIARKSKLYGLIGPANEAITPMEYDEFLWETTAYEDKGSETGFSTAGKRFVTAGGYVIFRKGKKWGAIDTKGQIVVPFDFDYVGKKESAGVSVKIGDRHGNYDIEKQAVKWLSGQGE